MNVQEDEAEIARRKMLVEDEDVDVDGMIEVNVNGTAEHVAEHDEDLLWALDEPDDDYRGWKMKVIIEEEDKDMI